MPKNNLTKSQTFFSISRYDLVIAAKIQKRWEELKNKAHFTDWHKQCIEKYA
jgi:hypothetical protein